MRGRKSEPPGSGVGGRRSAMTAPVGRSSPGISSSSGSGSSKTKSPPTTIQFSQVTTVDLQDDHTNVAEYIDDDEQKEKRSFSLRFFSSLLPCCGGGGGGATLLLWLWLLSLTVTVLWLHIRVPPSAASASAMPPPLPVQMPTAPGALTMHEYPFNIYEPIVPLRFPPRGTIPHLHWHRIQYCRVCCRYAPPGIRERLDCAMPFVLDQQSSSGINESLTPFNGAAVDGPTIGYVILQPSPEVLPRLTGARCVFYWYLIH